MAALVRRDGAFELTDGRGLRIQILAGDGILRPQQLIARQRGLRVHQLRVVSRQLTLCLIELDLERTRIDFGQERALVHDLSFDENRRDRAARRHGS